MYSMLNRAHQNYYGKRLHDFQRLQTLLKLSFLVYFHLLRIGDLGNVKGH